jgi:hypothetical protein
VVNISPSYEVAGRRVSPRYVAYMDETFSQDLARQLGEGNSTPVDVIGVKLVVHMINAFNRVVHRGTRVLVQWLVPLSPSRTFRNWK